MTSRDLNIEYTLIQFHLYNFKCGEQGDVNVKKMLYTVDRRRDRDFLLKLLDLHKILAWFVIQVQIIFLLGFDQ
jgi:hypothetical protein